MAYKIIAEDGKRRQHRQWLRGLLGSTRGSLRIASAYVTDTNLISRAGRRKVQLLTSLSRMDIASGATSLESLKVLIEGGVKCRCLPETPRFHAKVYIFGNAIAVITSANLTQSALNSNIEAGVELTGKAVSKLAHWFDAQWQAARPLEAEEVASLQRETAGLRRDYGRLRQKAGQIRTQSSDASTVPNEGPSSLRDLLRRANASRRSSTHVSSFLCNTDRKGHRRPPFVFEEMMHANDFAAAWLPFDHKRRMQEVKRGDAIFMYANGLGIVGIGEAQGMCEILEPGDPGRMREGWDAQEWRIPVEWLFWNVDEPCPWNLVRGPTFKEVSGVLYDRQRKAVQEYVRSRRVNDSFP